MSGYSRSFNHHAEVCPGEDCPRCNRLIDKAQGGEDRARSDIEYDDNAAADAYERRLGL